MEPVFGALLRQVRASGYQTLAYEDTSGDNSGDEFEQIARREQAQATNLVQAIFRERPDARVLIHVGYSHARELPERLRDGREQYWMAARLKAATGIDPLTIDQTRFTVPLASHVLCSRSDDNVAPMDLYVGVPALNFVRHRPTWLERVGRTSIAIPNRVRSNDELTIVTAHIATEPDDAIPADRVLAQPGEDIVLMLAPGRYRISGWTRSQGWTSPTFINVRR